MARSAGSSWTCGEELSAEQAFKRIHSIIFKKKKGKKRLLVVDLNIKRRLEQDFSTVQKTINPPIGLQAGV